MKPKVVLITGASSGMGKATANFLSAHGFVVYAGTREPKKLFKVQNQNLIPIFLDITSQENIDSVISQIIQENKTIDILINNAGYGLVSSVESCSEEEMFNQFNVNVFAVLRVSKAVIPIMRKQESGVIINISSFLGKIGLPLLTLYNSSKYAVEGITDSLRYELKEFGIRVHSILPGFFATEFARENLVINLETFEENSAYKRLSSTLAPNIVKQINNGNNAKEVAELILQVINDNSFPARATVGDKARQFLPMRKELSDEDFERRVREYYKI